MFELFESRNIKKFKPNGTIDCNENDVNYHYTSSSSLLSILKERNIRFTDAWFMNDKSEMTYFIDCLVGFLKENKGYPKCTETFEKLLLNGESLASYKKVDISTLRFYTDIDVFKDKKLRQFVFCLSESGDSLNMWNYYSHSNNYQGYNIGVNVKEFLKTLNRRSELSIDPYFIYYGKVIYTEQEQRQEIQDLCDSLEDDKLSPNQRIRYLWDYITTYGLFYKNSAFKNEEEYRIVISVSEDILHSSAKEQKQENSIVLKDAPEGMLNVETKEQKIARDETAVRVTEGQIDGEIKTDDKDGIIPEYKFDFYERKGIIVPYLSVRISKNAIKSITIAPTLDEKLAMNSLKEFLEMNGYEAKISNSKIPIRF